MLVGKVGEDRVRFVAVVNIEVEDKLMLVGKVWGG
jgi:hypothetical protein